ncbi:hypothetical protein MO973_25295 [Paenibacillus sp. TRM 82003]|nr:hypothetical protein [Paenibacillus sp. TRM 82003]
MKNQLESLHGGNIPVVEVEETEEDLKGTCNDIVGYNDNNFQLFTHARLKDYIQWFTKMGSFEEEFEGYSSPFNNVQLLLKEIDYEGEVERIEFGHPFPEEFASYNDLLKLHKNEAPDYFMKQYRMKGFSQKSKPNISSWCIVTANA